MYAGDRTTNPQKAWDQVFMNDDIGPIADIKYPEEDILNNSEIMGTMFSNPTLNNPEDILLYDEPNDPSQIE